MARARAEARRRIVVAIASVSAVVAIVAGLVVVKLTAAQPARTGSESLAPAAVVRQVTSVPPAVLSRVPWRARRSPRCSRSGQPGRR